jgi:hypothetical protein
MTPENFRALVVSAAGDAEAAALIVRMLVESQEAKRTLRAAGYGFTGMGLLETAREVPDNPFPIV